MCYERRRAEACADESAHHALVQDLLQSCARFITAGPINSIIEQILLLLLLLLEIDQNESISPRLFSFSLVSQFLQCAGK
jgi:hypothetical protein